MANSTHVYDVIVIGAGLSGLSGARLLADNKTDVLVLEARDRVGGRTYTVQNPKVNWVDLGGAYVGRGQSHLLRLIKEFGLKMYAVNEVENIVFWNNGKRLLFHQDENPALNFLDFLDFNHILRLMDQISEEIPVEAPWNAPHAEEWDKMTCKEFLDKNLHSKNIKDFMRIFIGTCVTNEVYESSLLWLLWYVKQCGGTKSIFSTTNGGQEFKVKGGTNQISECLADRLGWQRVVLNEPVYYLDQSSSNEVCVIKTVSGKEYHSRYIIMALPPAVQQKIHYNPPLPAMRNQLNQRAPMGSVLKCIVYYDKRFWKEKDMCGSILFTGDDYKFPITYTLDDSKDDGTHPAIVGFLPSDKARKLIDLTKEERLRIICESYAKAFDCDDARHPIHYEEQNWMQEQYSGGCYTMTCGPGFMTRYGPYLKKPIGKIYFAGTEVAYEWSGYMNGAIQAGEYAARQVLVKLGKLAPNQVHAIEPESKEYPAYKFPTTFFERHAPSATTFLKYFKLTSVSCASIALLVLLKQGKVNGCPFINQLLCTGK